MQSPRTKLWCFARRTLDWEGMGASRNCLGLASRTVHGLDDRLNGEGLNSRGSRKGGPNDDLAAPTMLEQSMDINSITECAAEPCL